MDPREDLFRREIVERLAAPDELDELLALEPWRGWPLLVAFLLIFASLFAWSLIPSVPVSIEGIGILFATHKPADQPSDRPATRALFLVSADSIPLLRRGQVATLRRLNLPENVAEPIAARVLKIESAALNRNELGERLANPRLAGRLAAEGLLWPVELQVIDSLQTRDLAQGESVIQVSGSILPLRQRPIDGLLPWRQDTLPGARQ
jgi:hypothetical protein